MCKNVFAITNGIIVLTFHELNLTKGRGRGLYGPESDVRPVPGPARDFSDRPGQQMYGDFSNGPDPGLKNRPLQTSSTSTFCAKQALGPLSYISNTDRHHSPRSSVNAVAKRVLDILS